MVHEDLGIILHTRYIPGHLLQHLLVNAWISDQTRGELACKVPATRKMRHRTQSSHCI